jgi:hypothetical protein
MEKTKPINILVEVSETYMLKLTNNNLRIRWNEAYVLSISDGQLHVWHRMQKTKHLFCSGSYFLTSFKS